MGSVDFGRSRWRFDVSRASDAPPSLRPPCVERVGFRRRRAGCGRRSTRRCASSTCRASRPSPSGSARRGRIGAEELTDVLNRVLRRDARSRLRAQRRRSLKFGGDALLLHFAGDDHALHAACGGGGDARRPARVGAVADLGRPRRAADVGRRPLGHRAPVPGRHVAQRARRSPARRRPAWP